MTTVEEVRTLMEIFHSIAPALNGDEILAISKVLYAALNRMEKESSAE